MEREERDVYEVRLDELEMEREREEIMGVYEQWLMSGEKAEESRTLL